MCGRRRNQRWSACRPTPAQTLPSPSPEQSPRLGEVLGGVSGRERSLVVGRGSVQGVEWVALASTDDMLLTDEPPWMLHPGWVCTYTQYPRDPTEERLHQWLPPISGGELIGRTAPFHAKGFSFLHGRADEQVDRVELHAGDLVTDGVALPLAALDLPDKVFVLAFPSLDGEYTLVAIDALGTEIDQVPITPNRHDARERGRVRLR